MRVILIRSNAVMPDPPVEKMANVLLSNGHEVKILAWDRDANYREKTSRIQLANHETDIIHFGIPAEYSGGVKKTSRRCCCFSIGSFAGCSAIAGIRYGAAFDFETGFASMLCSRVLGKKFVYHVLDYFIEGHLLSIQALNPIIEFLRFSD